MNIIEELHSNNIIKFNFEEFYTFASGIRSPIYLDLRKACSYPHIRKYFIQEVSQKFFNMKELNSNNPPTIVGTPYAAISWGAMVALTNYLPYLYLRKEAKKYGQKKLIEGEVSFLQESKEIIIFEDVVTTGKSSLETIAKIQGELNLQDKKFRIISLFNYQLNDKIPYQTDFLIGFEEIFQYIKNCSTMSQKYSQRLMEWNQTNKIT